MKTKKRKLILLVLIIFLLLNVVAFLHAYRFTHFNKATNRTKDPKELSALEKVKTLFLGIDNPRPVNKKYPAGKFKTVTINSTVLLEGWIMESTAKGTVIMFHGYAGEKSSLLERSELFLNWGYNVMLIDFMGSGGSEGSSTSIGFKEAVQVRDCYNYIQNRGEKQIILFGTSMGAAAILKAMDDYEMQVSSIILECPFGSLYRTVQARFDLI